MGEKKEEKEKKKSRIFKITLIKFNGGDKSERQSLPISCEEEDSILRDETYASTVEFCHGRVGCIGE